MSTTPYGFTAPQAFVTDSVISNVSITAGSSSSNSATFTIGGASGAETSGNEHVLSVDYGSTITGGSVIVYICQRIPGSNTFESTAVAWSFNHISTPIASTVMARNFKLFSPGQYQIVVANPTGNSTVTAVTLSTAPIQEGLG